MKLSENADLSQFLSTVQSCRGEARFCTQQGDELNLKSTLSQYLFAALAGNEALLQKGSIVCSLPEDIAMLSDFLNLTETQ